MAEKTGLPPRFYIVGSGGFQRADIVLTDLSPIDTELKRLASDSIAVIPRIASIEDQPVHLTVLPKNVTLLTPLKGLRLSTYFMAKPPVRRGQPARIVPVFDPSRSSIRLALTWSPPADMRVWFLAHFLPTPGGSLDTAKFQCASLVATHKGTPAAAGTFKLPLPNVYEDGKVCLGGDFVRAIQPTTTVALTTAFANALGIFQGNHWNADLLAQVDTGLTELMFAFDAADTTKQVPGPDDWYKRCTKVSNTWHASIPFKELS